MNEITVALAPAILANYVKPVKPKRPNRHHLLDHKDLVERFLWFTDPQPNGCWHYRHFQRKYGHCSIRFNGKNMFAHRAAYLLFVGPIPEGLFVCHKCDVGQCVNPDHLFLGTAGDNAQDMCRKGRHSKDGAKGELNGQAKLNQKQVLEIYISSLPGTVSQQEIAKQFGITQTLVSMIKNKRIWRHLHESNVGTS